MTSYAWQVWKVINIMPKIIIKIHLIRIKNKTSICQTHSGLYIVHRSGKCYNYLVMVKILCSGVWKSVNPSISSDTHPWFELQMPPVEPQFTNDIYRWNVWISGVEKLLQTVILW